MVKERRTETRQKAKLCYHAEIRLVGVPVYEVKLNDLSSRGASILVKEDSLLMNHLKSGQTIMVKFYFEDRDNSSEIFEAKIMHITLVKEGQFKGHYLAGMANLY